MAGEAGSKGVQEIVIINDQFEITFKNIFIVSLFPHLQ